MKKYLMSITILMFFIVFSFIPNVNAKAIIFDKDNKTIIMSVGEQKTFDGINTSSGEKITNYIKFTSSNKKIFIVNKNGKLKALKEGSASLICKSTKWNIKYRIIVKNKNLMSYGITYKKAKKFTFSTKPLSKYITDLHENNNHWYYFNLVSDGLVNFDLYPDTDMDMSIYLYGKDGEYCIADNYGKNKHIKINAELQSGKYYLMIKCNNSNGNYQLSANITRPKESNDSYSNNSFQNSQNLQLGTNITGHLGYISQNASRDIYDWYKFTIDTPSVVNFKLTGAPELKNQIELFQNDGASSITYAYGKDQVLSITAPLQKGTYYLLIKRLEGFGGYKIDSSIQHLSSDYTLEQMNNDSFQNAINISETMYSSGYIGYYNESGDKDTTDWYQINTAFNEEFTITVVPESSIEKLSVAIYEDDGATEVSSTYGSDEVISVTKKEKKNQTYEPKIYYIKVYCNNGYGGYRIFR